MRKISLLLGLLISVLSVSKNSDQSTAVDYVNPLMGTDSKHSLSNGNTYPAIALPWGMNFWMPQTGLMGDGWAYTYSADKIRGFKQTHQPSPWINDYGQFSIMPVTGALKIDQESRASWFSHKTEQVKPYYYSVYLADYDVTTEIAPTERCAAVQLTFPKSDSSYVVIDAFDQGSYIQIIPSERKIIGYSTRNSGGVPENFKNYFILTFDKPFSSNRVWAESKIVDDKLELSGNHVGAVIGFSTKRGEKINVQLSSSFIGFEQAEVNRLEVSGKSFEQVKEAGKKRWNEVLGVIDIDKGNLDQTRTFYSCLYRSVLFPRMFYEYDRDGKAHHYSPYNGKICKGYLFTDTGFWDTFRCLMPFVNLFYPSMGKKMQEGLLNAYLESGYFPEWASPGHRDCMIGNNSAAVVADAFMNNISDVDAVSMYQGLLHGAHSVHPQSKATGRLGWEEYNRLGYVPCDNYHESAARTLEYAYNDWCIYRMGKKLNRPNQELETYKSRARNYRNLFDPETNLMRGKKANGSFQTPFNPLKWGDSFTEGNSWHYTWSVFHDIQGLIELMGGEESFADRIDSVFHIPPLFDESYYGFVIHEIREMQLMNMGNYAHGNQPVQHLVYLYNHALQPWKAQYWLREIMNKFYLPTPDGYCGDEDNGQTSAWYVFSALGFYPVCPASGEYVLGAPLFKSAKLKMENGNTVNLLAPKNSDANRYIQKLTYNGKNYTKTFVRHADLIKGGKLLFKMDDQPNRNRSVLESDKPYSMSSSDE